MRNFLVFTLLALALIFTMLGNVGFWVDRTVYDTDTFVATTDDVLEDDEVRLVVAERLSTELYAASDLDARLRAELPEGLTFLALPLSAAARDFLEEATLRMLEREPLEDVRNRALRETHARLINVIEGESGAVSVEGDALVLDLRPVLERVAEDVLERDVNLPQQGGAEIPPEVLDQLPPEVRARVEGQTEDGLLGQAQLPEDAGRLVIEDSSIAWAYRIARYGNDIVYAIMGASAACFALAIAISPNRRVTVRNSGILLAVAGVASLALLLPVGYATERFAENGAAADAIVDIVTAGYKQQSLALIVVGSLIAGGAAFMGESSLAVAARSAMKRSPDGPSLREVVVHRAGALRVAALVAAAVVLIIWPEPSTRVYVTVLGLTAAYFAVLYLAISQSRTAQRARDQIERFWTQGDRQEMDPAESGLVRGYIGQHANLLRIVGVLAVAALLILWPEVSVRFVVMLAALLFIYLAAIELAEPASDRALDR